MGKYFTLIIVLVISFKLVIAQENYFDHTIKKGENVYMISRRYNVSPNAVFELNPGSRDIIYAGRTLKIPTTNNTNSSSTNTTITDTRVNNYKVKRGETKSGLSKRFGVSIAQLEQQNPHIVRMLQAGHLINLDKTITEETTSAKAGEHKVIKGETLWGIARTNGISVAQLEGANAGRLSEYLQIGLILTIPDKDYEVFKEGEYLVKPGDTKFGLAKRFNLTIAQLEEKNPHIVELLMAGHRIDVDNLTDNTVTNIQEDSTTNNVNNTEKNSIAIDTTFSESGYEDYVIQAKETLYGLAKKAGMPINEFTALNPKLLVSVNKGDIIKMPNTVSQNEASNDLTDNTTDDHAEQRINHKSETLLNNLITSTSNGIYFYTPFSSEELSASEEREKMIQFNVDFQKYIDFFQGAQIAIDSAKALHLNFDVTLIKKNIAKTQLKIDSPHKKNAFLVPFLDNASHYPKIESKQTFSVVGIESNINSKDSLKVYKSVPSENFQKTKTLNYLAKQDANVVIVSDLDEPRNKELIHNTLPDAQFLTVDNAGFFDSKELDKTLSKDQLNYLVLDSDKTIILLNTTTTLMRKLSDHRIQLVMLKSSLLPNQNEVSDMRYRVLKLIYPAITDPRNRKDIDDFSSNYQNVFGTKPTRYSQLGFDVTFDTLLRLSQNNSFEETINTVISQHPHLKFDYQKINPSSYSNSGVHLLQYNSNEGMIELE
ncbi:LysM peptidoglycan-binding domain-containing protein [Winogradskyella bathintestinalis]|uniref:LysM peptidoglycan-binding domain-containing protein n=1 Tax=Winogradskyella bathintestinalis TaxID=3035208 RepID=A0ABT7ZYI8_9FLAO|nr:LysM peptidoglycan-binding domain-containing protein [Winogradskyella bathintestinalis]MDN3494071.1 LysM peptidoglycan-binding domain-containing protein [Winogradskyella bathintestinalis]